MFSGRHGSLLSNLEDRPKPSGQLKCDLIRHVGAGGRLGRDVRWRIVREVDERQHHGRSDCDADAQGNQDSPGNATDGATSKKSCMARRT